MLWDVINHFHYFTLFSIDLNNSFI